MLNHKLDLSAEPYRSESGYKVWDLTLERKSAGLHSVAYVIVEPGCCVERHYHQRSEESYYFLKGRARMVIDGKTLEFGPNQNCLIEPGERHELIPLDDQPVEFLAISAPAFSPDDYLRDSNYGSGS